jgi:hypothetical protein
MALNNPSMVYAFSAGSAYLSTDSTGVSTDGTPNSVGYDTSFFVAGITLPSFPGVYNPLAQNCISQMNATVTVSNTGDATSIQAYFDNQLGTNYIFYSQTIAIPNSSITMSGSALIVPGAAGMKITVVLSGGTLNNAVIAGATGTVYPTTYSGIVLRSNS